MDIDLNTLSLKELRELNTQVTRAISSFEDRKRKSAISELEDAARKHGYTLGELTGAVSARKRMPARAKYANPDNPVETWSGRGRRPRWIDAALKSGKSLDQMAT